MIKSISLKLADLANKFLTLFNKKNCTTVSEVGDWLKLKVESVSTNELQKLHRRISSKNDYQVKSNFHYTDLLVTSSSDELAGKLRGSYGLVANFWPSPRGSHGEVGRVGPSRHVKMVCRVGGLVGDKSCRVAVMEIGLMSSRDDRSPRFRRQTVKVEVRTGAIVKNSEIL